MVKKIRSFSTDSSRVEEKRGQIAKAALKVMSRHGIKKTGMREIAKASNMALSNLYHYIGKKDDVVYLAVNYAITQRYHAAKGIMDLSTNLNATDALEFAIDKYIRHQHETKEYTIFFHRELSSINPSLWLTILEQKERAREIFSNIFQRGIEEGVFKSSNLTIITEAILNMGEMWALKYFVEYKNTYSLDDYIGSFAKLILNQVCVETRTVQSP